MACSANNILAAKTLEVFVASLQEEAFAWYLRQPPFADWNALKTAFLDHLRPLEFANSLKERLRTIRMGINERWTTITGGCKILCNIWEPTLCILYVYPIELKTYVKEGGTSTYAQAYGRAKIWEGCRLKFGTTVHWKLRWHFLELVFICPWKYIINAIYTIYCGPTVFQPRLSYGVILLPPTLGPRVARLEALWWFIVNMTYLQYNNVNSHCTRTLELHGQVMRCKWRCS